MAEKSDARIVTRAERNKATNQRDNAEGPPDEAKAHNARPNDLSPVVNSPALDNSTLASRAKASSKKVDEAEDKSVKAASTKKS